MRVYFLLWTASGEVTKSRFFRLWVDFIENHMILYGNPVRIIHGYTNIGKQIILITWEPGNTEKRSILMTWEPGNTGKR